MNNDMDYALRMEDSAARLKQARHRAGYAHASDAAHAFGWPAPSYLAHENGNRGITTDTAAKYARAFRVPVSWLLFGEKSIDGHGLNDPPAAAPTASRTAAAPALDRPRLNETNFVVKDGVAEIFAVTDRKGIAQLRRFIDLIEAALADPET